MDERRTHYQASFTSRQAVALFVGLIALLALSYFFGLMTGLSGRAGREPEAAAPAPEPEFPVPERGVSPQGAAPARSPRPTAEPTAAATPVLQLFEDRSSSEPTRAPAAPAAQRFWVQVDSLSSREEAEKRRAGLSRAGWPAAVVPGAGPKGPVFRVRVGPYPAREEAERVAEKLSQKAKGKPWVVPPGQ